MALVQLSGGAFQDASGAPLAGGYINMRLSQDAQAIGFKAIGASHVIRIPLDSNGNVVASPAYSVWSNDSLLPNTTSYEVCVYDSVGEMVWGPNYQTVPSSPSPYDVGQNWIPSNYTGGNGGSGLPPQPLFPIQQTLTKVTSTVYQIPNPPLGGVIIALFYNALYLDPTQYTLSGSTVTLTFATQIGDSLYAVHF